MQQVVAPVEGRAQGLMPGRCRTSAADEHAEDVAKSLGQLSRGQYPHPRGRQLDRQRQAVKPSADGQHGARVGVRDPKGRAHQLRPLLEQLDRVAAGKQRGGRRQACGRQRKRRHRPAALAFHAEGLAAGGEHDQGWTGGEDALGQPGRGARQVLAVVEHDQHRPFGDVLGDGLCDVLPGGVGYAEPGRDRRTDDAGVVDLGRSTQQTPPERTWPRRSRPRRQPLFPCRPAR